MFQRNKFLFENLNRSHHSEDLGIDGKIMFKRVSSKQGMRELTGLIWLRTGTSGEILETS
jgi:hypothetical protein